jgi:hypothetical protein
MYFSELMSICRPIYAVQIMLILWLSIRVKKLKEEKVVSMAYFENLHL